MNIWHSLAGMVTVELTSADIFSALQQLQNMQVAVQDLEMCTQLKCRFCIRRTDWNTLYSAAARRGDTVCVVHSQGLYWTLQSLIKRPVLVIGLACLLAFSLWVPGRIFFIQVEGNSKVPSMQIIEKAQTCGISFGASRRDVRSEKIKNNLLNAMPQLQWAGVNTYGCVAVITVRERSELQTPTEQTGIGHIVAITDAVVTELTVLKGTALCKPGQAVIAGQRLVSGYTDCGLYIQAGKAEAEVFGATKRKLSAMIPTQFVFRRQKRLLTKKYSLVFGKKRINFAKDSGILGATCAKIETDYKLTLPGGFILPVSLVVESYYSYDETPGTFTEVEHVLTYYGENYLKQKMIAGQIENASCVVTPLDGVLRMDAVYDCVELIGISRQEEFIYGKTD